MTSSGRELVIETVEKAYAMLEFEPGGQPDWSWVMLYSSRAVLALRVFPDDAAVSIMSWAEYKRAQMKDDLSDHGYSETPGERTIFIMGDVANVQQRFTMNFRHRSPAEAVDIFGLVRHRGSWRIVSVLSDLARSDDDLAPNPPSD